MIAAWLLRLLIAEYLVIALAFACSRDWARCLYFTSAAGISVAVAVMQ